MVRIVALVVLLLAIIPRGSTQSFFNPIIVPDNATLQAVSGPSTNGVIRMSPTTGGPVIPLQFKWVNQTCTSQSLVNDGGSCVTANNGGSFVAQISPSGIDARQFKIGSNTDSQAINAAISVLRTAYQNGTPFNMPLLLIGTFTLPAAINLTCINDVTGNSPCTTTNDGGMFLIIGQDSQINCQTNAFCFDQSGSNRINWKDVNLVGSCTGGQEPTVGFVQQRIVTQKQSGFFRYSGVRTSGCFSIAAYYTFSGEVTVADSDSQFENNATNTFSTSAGPYAVILDNANIWNLGSTFVTQTMSANTLQSFNEMQFIGGTIDAQSNVSTANALWMGGTVDLVINNTFLRSNSGVCITHYYNSGATAASYVWGARIIAHCEGYTAPTTYLQVVSRSASSGAVFENPVITDNALTATTQIFAADSNTSTVSLRNEKLTFINHSGGPPAMFDTPSKYFINNVDDDYIDTSVSGWIPTVGGVNCSGLGSGGTCAFLGSVGTMGRAAIALTTGSSGTGSNGAVDMTDSGFTVGSSFFSCSAALSNAAGGWNGGATVQIQNNSRKAVIVAWSNNGSALTTSVLYLINIRCRGG